MPRSSSPRDPADGVPSRPAPRRGVARAAARRGGGPDGERGAGGGRGGARGTADAARGARGGRGAGERGDGRRPAGRRRVAVRRGSQRAGAREYRAAAGQRLRNFRQAGTLAVAMTGIILLLGGAPAATQDPAPAADTPAAVDTILVPVDTAAVADTGLAAEDTAGLATTTARGVEEATGTVRQLVRGVYRLAPKLLVALALVVLAALLARLVRPLLRRLLASFARAEAISALVVIGLWVVAVSAALSVLAGDARTLLGSVGLLGLALSWALQAPIESFSGWLLNSFRGYYRVGDRILVGDVFGDVYRIDFLTTTVWEAGGPGKPVQGAQPTGALITFPNSDVLRANITNYTRDFPYVWDEITVAVANESDLDHALEVIGGVAERTVGEGMATPVDQYARLLAASGLPLEVASRPQLYVSPTDAWIDVTVRYLVPARERRRWATELHRAVIRELARPEHAARVEGAYPVTRVELRRRAAPGAAGPAAPTGGPPDVSGV